MSLQAFSFPFPETRLIRAGRLVYKFKIRAGSSFSGEEMMAESISQELEDIIRTVLGNLDSLQPFSSSHFNVFPYKKQWEGASKVICKHSEKTLRAYPFIFILYVEKNTENENHSEKKLSHNTQAWQYDCVSEPQSKCCTGYSPAEDAILKDLSERSEAEGKVSVIQWLNMDNPRAEEMAQDVDVFSNPQLNSTVTGSDGPGKVQPEKTTDKEEEEEQRGEEGENSSGIVTRLASTILSFSWFFKDL